MAMDGMVLSLQLTTEIIATIFWQDMKKQLMWEPTRVSICAF